MPAPPALKTALKRGALLAAANWPLVVKGGTVAVLAEAEAAAGPTERPPLRLEALRRANMTEIGRFLDGCKRLWQRYLKLGACLLVVYALTAAVYIGFIVGGYALVDNSGVLLGWGMAAAVASSVLVVWVTVVNFLYLLTQMAIAVDDIGVRAAMARVSAFLRGSLR